MYTNIIHNDDICNYFLKNQQFIFNSLGNCREYRLFAPAPSTISFVPLTRNLSLADPSPYPVRVWTGLSEATATRFSVLRTTKCDAFSEARRTKNRLLRYGIRIRCSKRLPGVRDASSEALGVKNRLFRYGRDSRCAKQTPGVRDASSVRGTASARRRANTKRGCIPWKSLRIHPHFLNVLCPGPDSNRHIFKG